MTTAIQKILKIAEAELGTTSGTKYREWYYGRENTAAWCCIFLMWCFEVAGLRYLLFDGQKTAYCPTLLSWFTGHKQIVPTSDAKAGDIIFFDWTDDDIHRAQHVGIVLGWKGDKIRTIEGNTESGKHKSCVARKIRPLSQVKAIARPNYPKGELDMTEKELIALIQKTVREIIAEEEVKRANENVSSWAKDAMEYAVQAGMTDGTRPRDFCRREEAILMLKKALELK